MRELLEDVAAKLRSNAYANEEHVRLSLVARLLQVLGWDIWNPLEVNTEFRAVRSEDSTRVDIALFARRAEPSVYLEVKAVGTIARNLPQIEVQMRDYNRNNTATFSILTDGRHWRFYLSRAGGEFGQKCFKEFDLLDDADDFESIELAFHAFLSKEEVTNGRALREAEQYLNSSQRQRAMRDALPTAKRELFKFPELSFSQLLVRLVTESGYDISAEEAIQFIHRASSSSGELEESKSIPNPIPKPSILPSPRSSGRTASLVLRRKGQIIARGYEDANGKFIVLAGSVAALEVQDSGESKQELRTKLVSDGVFKKEASGLVLIQDYPFSSWSAAACVFLGRSASGPREWQPQ